MSDAAIRTDNLTRDFATVRALDGLSLTVPAGTIFGFLGANGAGKTTTIRLLLGLLEPSAGSATVLGYDTRRQADEVRTHCGALLEHSGLYERLNAEDNLEFYARVWHMPKMERQARIKELLEHIDLWDRRGEAVGTWSRGMKQKLAVVRTILHHPQLIFLDEPTAGLDPVAAAALHKDLLNMTAREGVTVFLTTHNLAEAEKICTQVGVIRQGKLLAVGAPADLRASAGAPKVEIVGRGFNEAVLTALRAQPQVSNVTTQDGHLLIELRGASESAPLVSLVVSNGGEVEEVRRDQASLEDVFLTLMEEDKNA